MNAIVVDTPELAAAQHRQYICRRVLDALLREDVRACVSAATVVARAALPPQLAPYAQGAASWLKVAHFGAGCLWLPVVAAQFMQDWRSDGMPLWQEDGRAWQLQAVEDVIACFARGLEAGAAALFHAFSEECKAAATQRAASEAERQRWFAALRAQPGAASGADLPDWHARLLHFDRLGAFLDHPLYPTARAKLGFDEPALAAYGPEFGRSFQLRWLAVPRALVHPSRADEQGWPSLWPGFEQVGLPAAMARTHALVPVHPFVWAYQLDAYLSDAGLLEHVVRAPLPCLNVAPTLSVRTVVLLDAPEWHLKLPLTIRTLGAKNIRTIKPSTIRDGHSIQSLLGAIARQEPSIGARLLLTDEECGAHVDQRMFLAYILRCYPAGELQDSVLVPVPR